MRLLRRLLFTLTTSLLRLVVIFGVTGIALLLAAGSPSTVERTLAKTNVYHQFVPALLQTQRAQGQNSSSFPLQDHEVQNIINESFPPATIQHGAETFIDATYGWLNGRTKDITYRIDFTPNRALMSENLTIYAFNRLASQPLCKTIPSDLNPFTATCLPPNFSIKAERAAFSQQVNNLLPKTVFTAQDLPKLANGQRITERFSYAPMVFRSFQYLPYGFVILVAGLTALLLLQTRTKRRGVQILGSIAVSSGIALIVTPILYELVYPHITSSLSLQGADTGVNPLINTAIDALSRNPYTYLIVGAIIVINIGFSLLIGERLTRPNAYHDLAERVGLASSDAKPKRRKSSRGLSAANLPIQSSEVNAKTKARRRYRRYRTLHDKEL